MGTVLALKHEAIPYVWMWSKFQDTLLGERSRAENDMCILYMQEGWMVIAFSRDLSRGMREDSEGRELGSSGRGGQWGVGGACGSFSALSAFECSRFAALPIYRPTNSTNEVTMKSPLSLGWKGVMSVEG